MAFMTSNRTAKKHPKRSSLDDQGEYMHDYEQNDDCEFHGVSQLLSKMICLDCNCNYSHYDDLNWVPNRKWTCDDDEERCRCGCDKMVTPENPCGRCKSCQFNYVKPVELPQYPFLSVQLFPDGQPMAAPESEEYEIEPLDDAPSTIQNDPFWTSKPFRRICTRCDGNCECENEDENVISTPYDKPYHLCVDCNEMFECPEFDDTSSCHCHPINIQCDSCEGKETMACWGNGTISWEHGTWKPNTVPVVETEKLQLSVQADFSTDDSPTPTPMAADETCKCLFGEECNSCAPRMSFPCLSCTIPIFCSAPMICRDCV